MAKIIKKVSVGHQLVSLPDVKALRTVSKDEYLSVPVIRIHAWNTELEVEEIFELTCSFATGQKLAEVLRAALEDIEGVVGSGSIKSYKSMTEYQNEHPHEPVPFIFTSFGESGIN